MRSVGVVRVEGVDSKWEVTVESGVAGEEKAEGGSPNDDRHVVVGVEDLVLPVYIMSMSSPFEYISYPSFNM